MLISGRNAVDKGFVFNPGLTSIHQDNIGDASVDLTVGTMLTTDGKRVLSPKDDIIIKPQQTAVIISSECFNLPSKIIAQALMKNRLSQEGLIAFNTGIIDSKYKKPISTMVTNLSKNEIVITKGQPFLRVVFHRLDESGLSDVKMDKVAQAEIAKNIFDYVSYRKKDIAKLPRDFFSIGEIKESIAKELKELSIAKFFTFLGGGVAIFVIGANIGVPKIQSYFLEEKIEKTEQSANNLEKRVVELEEKIIALTNQKKKESERNQ